MYVSNHFNHCIKLFAPCGPLIGNNKFLFLFLYCPGADPGFQLRGGGKFLKIAPSGGRREKFWGISCEKSLFFAKKSYFFKFMGGGGEGGAECAPTGSAPVVYINDNR